MRKNLQLAFLLVILATCLAPMQLSAQNYRLEMGINAGGSNYLGDIGGKYLSRKNFISDIKIKQTSLTGGLYARYALTPKVSMSLGFQYGRIRGDDSLTTNPGRHARNLSFRNDIKEFSLLGEYEIYEAYNVGGNTRYRIDYSLYMTGGVGYYLHNPQANFNGKWVDLQPLKTEGVSYSLSGLSTILGFGMDFTLDRNYRIGFKLTTHFTGSDYLDDISTTYPAPSSFAKDEQGQLALALSDRKGELDPAKATDPNDNTPSPDPRGNPKYDDSYIFATINFAYVFKGKGDKYRREFHNGYVRKKGKRLGVTRFFAF